MTTTIDNLSEQLSNSMILNMYNPSSYQLYLENSALYAQQCIGANVVLGELSGKPSYIWELKHNDYIIVDDELVLDIIDSKTNMLNFVREENVSSNISNSYIYMQLNKNGEPSFFLITKNSILPYEEIVYNAQEFVAHFPLKK